MSGLNSVGSAFLEVGGLKKGRLNPIPGPMGHGNTFKQLFTPGGHPSANKRDTMARMTAPTQPAAQAGKVLPLGQ
jgi:hypothetical protein